MLTHHHPLAQTNQFIVVDRYTKTQRFAPSYQSEDQLEREMVQDLKCQGYEFSPDITSQEKMLGNVRLQLQRLNNIKFNDDEWHRFVIEYLDKPSENSTDKARKVHEDHVYQFVFDNGNSKNIILFDKDRLHNNHLQVIKQFEQSGKHDNRYDVTILVNGLPLVQIELKRRGVAIRQAFNQIHRYSKESFNSEHSLYKYLQFFVISNGTDTRYFANTTKRNKNSFDFTMNWADKHNEPVKELKDFTQMFFEKNVILKMLFRYSVFNSDNVLMILRPYQVAATERILDKIQSSVLNNNWSNPNSGGYIWHTTGSGKTLTSFKAARLATSMPGIDRVFFVVDRKDLDYQTMKEYQKFSKDSVNGSSSTAELKRNLTKKDNKIVVTTIQKLNNLMKAENNLPVYNENVVFILDECHRSQFGEAQKNLQRKFKRYCQFGFTGTPIFPENASGEETTGSVFGKQLHSYVITDAIRDEKVLKFKVDYHNVLPTFKKIEEEQDVKKLSASENKKALQHPERIKKISTYILDNFNRKTNRLNAGATGFNAMFAVSNVESAKHYYEKLNELQSDRERKLKIATIYSFAANEEQDAIGEIEDESLEATAMNSSDKEFLVKAVEDYNRMFKTTHSIDGDGFQNYYRDLALRVKTGEVDLLIVVGMFLTGFDAPTLNTVFVDKNLRYHGLIQCFSRSNRIYDSTKSFGNIVTFRDLEQATIDAIQLFGKENSGSIILEKSYQQYMEGYDDNETGRYIKGFKDVVDELHQRFPDPAKIELESDKKDFTKLFGEYLKMENILQNYDEFHDLKQFKQIDPNDEQAIDKFKQVKGLTDAEVSVLKTTPMPNARQFQDYCSSYNDIRDWHKKEQEGKESSEMGLNWDDIEFEIDLIKTQEINLDFILELIFKQGRENKSRDEIITEAKRLISSSIGNRAKEGLIVEFIQQADFDKLEDNAAIIDSFYQYAQEKLQSEAESLIQEEELKEEEAKYYIQKSLKREHASDEGTDLNDSLPRMSPLSRGYKNKKSTVFNRISKFVEKFKGIGSFLS